MLSVRQRIALWFVGLSTLVYITPTILGVIFFYITLTGALDHELKTLASSLGHAVDVRGGKPQFRDWARIVQTDPKRSLSTIQLYDAQGNLLEQYGAQGISALTHDRKELSQGGYSMRVIVTPLISNQSTIGYLQIQVPTKERDVATRHFALTMALIAPFVLIGLGICSLYVSDKATIPIRRTIEMLRQFVADAGHELNTPVSIIGATTEALERKLEKQGAPMKEIGVLTTSVSRMRRIISDLMLLADLETPIKPQEARALVRVDELIEDCLAGLSFPFEQKGIAVQCASLQPTSILGDRESLRVLIINLLENALRYTDAGGIVRIELKQEPGNIKVSISDTGIGIPLESQPLIFDRFFRVDKSRSRASGGSGLGLSIVKAIVEAHEGSIVVTSKPGEGTRFSITLPINS